MSSQFYGRKLSIKGVNVNNATDKQLILKEDFDNGNTIYYDVNGVPNVLLGNRLKNTANGLASNQGGFFVGKPGIDVTQATNSQLIFNSGNDVFKIVVSGTTTIPGRTLSTSSSYFDTIQIAHGLPYVPIMQAYGLVTYNAVFNNTLPVQLLTGYATLPFDGISPFAGVGNLQTFLIKAITDATNVYFTYFYQTNGSGSYTFPAVPIKYYLLQETAT
jgi:hypothetical protein